MLPSFPSSPLPSFPHIITVCCSETKDSIIYLPHFAYATAKLLQSCLTLCDPTDGSPPASPIPGILQARTLEWVVISFSNA